MFRVAAAVCLARVFLLNVRRIGQHETAQVLCRWCAENPTAVAAGDKTWKVAAVIEVRVRQHDDVERGRLDGQRRPVALAEFLDALEQTAVDQDTAAVELEQMLRSGHGARRTKESQRKSEIQRQSLPLARAIVQDYTARD